MNWFGSPYPRDREARESRLEAAAEADLDPFDKPDEEVANLIYEESARLKASALEYVKAHAS